MEKKTILNPNITLLFLPKLGIEIALKHNLNYHMMLLTPLILIMNNDLVFLFALICYKTILLDLI